MNNGFRNRIISSTRALYSAMHSKQIIYTENQLDSLLAENLLNPTYNGQSETLNILFNSGKIIIIRNDSVKNALVVWPLLLEDTTEDELFANHFLFDNLLPILKKYLSTYEIYKQINFRGYALFDNPTKSDFSNNYSALFDDRLFENTLAERELPISIAQIQSKELIEKAREIIRLIDEEIK